MNAIKIHLKQYWFYYVTIILIVGSIWHILIRINKPFYAGHHLSGHLALQGTTNENFLQNGYLKMMFGVSGYKKDDRCPKSYYINHPCFGNVISSLPTLVLGNSEWVVRSIQLMFYLLNLFLLFLIGSHLFDKKLGLLMAIIYSFLPINRIFSILPAYHGTLFYTFLFLIIYFIYKYDEREKPLYIILVFLFYFLSILHEWLSVVNGFVILSYYIFLKRNQFYKGIFYLIALTNLAIFINFLHISILLGRIAINEPINSFMERVGNVTSFMDKLPFYGYLLILAFGIGLIFALAGIAGFYKIRNNKFRTIFYSQVAISLFFIILFKGALYVHWYLYMCFSLLITLLIIMMVNMFKKYRWVSMLVVVVLVIINSQYVLNKYNNNQLNKGFEQHPIVESLTHFRPIYSLAHQFTESNEFDNETLVLLKDPGFYIADYYLGRYKFCFDVVNRMPRTYHKEGFNRVVYIELNDKNQLTTHEINATKQ